MAQTFSCWKRKNINTFWLKKKNLNWSFILSPQYLSYVICQQSRNRPVCATLSWLAFAQLHVHNIWSKFTVSIAAVQLSAHGIKHCYTEPTTLQLSQTLIAPSKICSRWHFIFFFFFFSWQMDLGRWFERNVKTYFLWKKKMSSAAILIGWCHNTFFSGEIRKKKYNILLVKTKQSIVSGVLT